MKILNYCVAVSGNSFPVWEKTDNGWLKKFYFATASFPVGLIHFINNTHGVISLLVYGFEKSVTFRLVVPSHCPKLFRFLVSYNNISSWS